MYVGWGKYYLVVFWCVRADVHNNAFIDGVFSHTNSISVVWEFAPTYDLLCLLESMYISDKVKLCHYNVNTRT